MRSPPLVLFALILASPAMAEVGAPLERAATRPTSAPAASRPASQPASKHTASAPALAASAPVGKPSSTPTKKRPSKSPSASLAVVNLGQRGALGWKQAQEAHNRLERFVGGWAETPSVAATLFGDPGAGVLPSSDVGKRIGPLLERLRRPGRPSIGDLFRLGRLLGVDYLLLMRVRGGATSSVSISARLFSVHRQEYAPQGFEREDDRVVGLLGYVKHQLRERKSGGLLKERWWVWAVAGAVAVVTLILSAVSDSGDEGALKIRVHR